MAILNALLIKDLREMDALTQEDLVEICDFQISVRTLWAAENGEDVSPTTHRIIAKALRVYPPDQLLAWRGITKETVKRLPLWAEDPVSQRDVPFRGSRIPNKFPPAFEVPTRFVIRVVTNESIHIGDASNSPIRFPWDIRRNFTLKPDIVNGLECASIWRQIHLWAEGCLYRHLSIADRWARFSSKLPFLTEHESKQPLLWGLTNELQTAVSMLKSSPVTPTSLEQSPIGRLELVTNLHNLPLCYDAVRIAIQRDGSVAVANGSGNLDIEAVLGRITEWLFGALRIADDAVARGNS